MGVGWFDNPDLIHLHDYKRTAPKFHWPEYLKALSDKVGFERAWVEKQIVASEHDRTVWNGLLKVVAYALHVRRLPVPLADWQAAVNEGRPGPKSRANMKRRNEVLAYMVGYVSAKVRIPPTRNEGSPNNLSACDAVAAAVPTSYYTVLKAWQAHHDDILMPLPDPVPDQVVWVPWGNTWIKAKREEHKSRSELLSELEGLDRDPFERVEDFHP